ncbi:hypothetical protein HHI36_023902 [Cryptolaemus montrouzieri]|uniref:Uncharacterized protein n=1 Tax=Cryptolaemus montrouzieri TaxID=559131 RepID=A0ABD2NP95_9CUCU
MANNEGDLQHNMILRSGSRLNAYLETGNENGEISTECEESGGNIGAETNTGAVHKNLNWRDEMRGYTKEIETYYNLADNEVNNIDLDNNCDNLWEYRYADHEKN